ncbi:rho GTPase-activating protein 19 isoform X3 [Anopheles aquasalis]|uniref:rho GTPase-activating protein 19 isoform X3 n=1 Tax=Anopheles aquasalis TaxID=42839 RepID=UPI00215AC56A|nr:rho GTPase-activating protein 19 isoform X3 [Anopheles aquasalis]
MMAVQSLATKVRLNQDTAKRLQDEHPEQFVTLVRMHLSFLLDLNTDTENDPVELDKQKIKKWKGFHKKAKGCTSVKATTSPETAKTTLTAPIISNLRQLIAFLEQEHNISQEGIFRKTGSLARQGELKNLLVQGNTLPLDQGDYTAHDCASVLKNFLSELSEPLLTELYYPAYRQVAESFSTKDKEPGRGEDWLLNALQLLLLLLPEENHSLLHCLIDLLYRTVQHEATNKMSAENLAKLFTPHLICPRKLSANALHETASQMFVIVEFMIKTGPRLFHIPTKLATDIRAYFVEQNRRRTMSPEHILNESTTSDSVANTVYTFVDRQKTAEAHIIDSTDTALAELYAHIQSLPESSKKKKLVSKFNHQNRYGTPVQRSSGGSAGGGGSVGPKYPRSFGDSIKRHIFHKSLMSRTPKRSATAGGTQTPTLFQESIMTPRSRKPVMMLAALHGNDQQHQLSSTTCASFSSLREEDEESDPEPMIEPASLLLPAGPRPPTQLDQNIIKLINDTGLPPIADEVGLPPLPIVANQQPMQGATLTSSFRDYLLSRSVMPESPTDLSFASQSDDFESSSEILERSESKMSESLLHVLDGNVPPVETEEEGQRTVQPAPAVVNSKPIGELDETDL